MKGTRTASSKPLHYLRILPPREVGREWENEKFTSIAYSSRSHARSVAQASFFRLFQVLVEPVRKQVEVLADRRPAVVRAFADDQFRGHALGLQFLDEHFGLSDRDEPVFVPVDDQRRSAFLGD